MHFFPVFRDVTLRIDVHRRVASNGAAALARPLVNRAMSGRRHRDDLRSGIGAALRCRAGQGTARIRFVTNEIGADIASDEFCADAANEGCCVDGVVVDSERLADAGNKVGWNLGCGPMHRVRTIRFGGDLPDAPARIAGKPL